MALFPGGPICRGISLVGFGDVLLRPMNTTEFAHSVLATLSYMPMISKKRPSALRARGSISDGTSAPKSSKYPISGAPKILLKSTECRIGEQSYRSTSSTAPNSYAFGGKAARSPLSGFRMESIAIAR